MRRFLWLSLALASALTALMAGCVPVSPAGAVEIRDPWARAAPMGMENGAAYMTVLNRSGAEDRLRSAKASIAGVVELHETVLDGEMMKMEPHPEGFALPAGGELELKPGGKHVMLIGLNEPLAEGRTFELTLVFERAGPMTVTVPVRTP